METKNIISNIFSCFENPDSSTVKKMFDERQKAKKIFINSQPSENVIVVTSGDENI